MNLTPVLMMLVLAAAFWLMVLRPAKSRQAAALKVQNGLAIGQRVMTTAGLFGYVREITPTEIGLEISDGVVVRYVREAIAKIVEDPANGIFDDQDVSSLADSDSNSTPSTSVDGSTKS